MSEMNAAALQLRSDDLQARYQYRFAGKSRATRSIEEIEALVRDAQALVSTSAGVADASDELLGLVRQRAELFAEERDRILAAHAEGPRLREASVLGARANLVFAMYRRHFAGQGRRTRDAALLDELIDQLRGIHDSLRGLLAAGTLQVAEDNLRVVERNIEMYVSEHEAIVGAQAEVPGEERTSMLAQRANDQFALYKEHFAGHARTSRRPQLLERTVATLDALGPQMAELVSAGVAVETNRKNLGIVEQRVSAYRAELEQIHASRTNASVFELIDALGQAANACFESYAQGFAGKDRKTRDLAALGVLCDRLFEVERQMSAIADSFDHPMNTRNLQLVQDTLQTYGAEWGRIREAQAGEELQV